MNALQAFRNAFGREPWVVFEAPGRVNLIGDHTDYQGGFCLPVGLALATTVAVAPRADAIVRARSDFGPEAVKSSLEELRSAAESVPMNGLRGFLAAVAVLIALDHGVDVHITSTLPSGSGLSSSAALSLGLIAALAYPRALEAAELIRLAQSVENRYLGVASGVLDQTAIVHARRDHAVHIDAGEGTARPIPFAYSAAGYLLAIIDTRTPRTLAASGYGQRVDETRRAAAALGLDHLRQATLSDLARIADPLLRRRAHHVVSENARVGEVVEAAGKGRFDDVAEAFNESHRSLRDDFEVSTPALDRAVDAVWALNRGGSDHRAGARVTGAGFGGSVVALLPAEAKERLIASLAAPSSEVPEPRLYWVPRPEAGLRRIWPEE